MHVPSPLSPLVLALGAALAAVAGHAAPQGEDGPRPTEAAGATGDDAFELVLPPGPVAEAWAAVGPETPHASLSRFAGLPTAPDDPRWNEPEPWDAWVRLVRAEASAPEPDPERRAELALLALAQGRTDDAWAHLAACRARPDLVAALLPVLLFGPEAVAGAEPARGRTLPGLADGAELRLAPPPLEPNLPPGTLPRRELSIEGLRVGGAKLAMKLSVDPDGAQVDLEHRSGPAARLTVLVPQAPDREVVVEYFDWERVDTIGVPHRFELVPDGERLSAWARYASEGARWPRELPIGPLALFRAAGLELVVAAGDPGRPRLARAAAALGELFDAPASLREPDRPPARPGAIEVDLAPGPLRDGKLAATISLAERHALDLARPAAAD